MAARVTQEDVLVVEGLTVDFGGVRALDRVDLSVRRDSITGLIGPNGAGKTTLIDAVTGFTDPSAGTVHLDGTDLSAHTPSQRAARGLVRTFQSLELFEDLSVADNLAVATEAEPWWGIFAEAVGRTVPSSRVEDTQWALDLLGISDIAGSRPDELSHGQRRLVSVARALAARPEVVLLDEPAAGLDTAETELLGERLRSLPDAGVTTLLIDHDMSLVLGVCSDVHVLDFGRIIASGPAQDVRTDPAVIAAYLGVPT